MSGDTPPSVSTIKRTQKAKARDSIYSVIVAASRSGFVNRSWDSASFLDLCASAASAWL